MQAQLNSLSPLQVPHHLVVKPSKRDEVDDNHTDQEKEVMKRTALLINVSRCSFVQGYRVNVALRLQMKSSCCCFCLFFPSHTGSKEDLFAEGGRVSFEIIPATGQREPVS